MKKTLKKQAALMLLSATIAVQAGVPGYAATTVTGSWKNENGAWKFYNSEQKAYTGWVKTESGWYYLNPSDGKMATGWQKIGGHWYYFDTAAEGIEGKMHTGWYQTPDHKWFFFNNQGGTAQEGHMATGWQWIDGYCYYFSTAEGSEEGTMYAGRKTPDGYLTNENGQWTQGHVTMYRQGAGFVTKSTVNANKTNANTGNSDSDSDSGSSSGGGSSNKPDAVVEYQYLLMNIPYSEFYAAEVSGNDVSVDAVSSATKAKPRTGTLVAGSYHTNEDGSNISGVIYPVRIAKGTDLSKFKQITDSDSLTITVTNRGKEVTTTYSGKDALFESADYSYYILNEAPSYYKEVSVDKDGKLSFGKTVGTEKNIDGVSAKLSTTSNYGDYQLNLDGMPDISTADVYGVVLHTEEGEDFGLRHMENIWLRTNLAWSAGFVTTTHGNQLSSAHYESMMGKKLSGMTYYTSEGILKIPFAESVYVPIKIAAGLTIGNTAINSGKTGVEVAGVKYPSDFEIAYKVKNALGKESAIQYNAENGKLTWEGSLTAGNYTLTVEDKSGRYAPISGTFTLETETVPAAFTLTEDGWKVTKADGTSDEEFEAYLASITKVKVGKTEYAVSGRGAVTIIDTKTGDINFSAKANDKDVFTAGEQYELEITADGYKNNLTGMVTAAEKKAETEEYQYLLMNIPYSEFYAAEVKENDVAVDAVSSATKTKTKTGRLVGGSYHKDELGESIDGVTYPVRVVKGTDLSAFKQITDEDHLSITVTNRGQTSTDNYDGKDALFQSADYSYYILPGKPEYYKELTVNEDGTLTFGNIQTEKENVASSASAELLTESNYGDYQVKFTEISEDISNASKVYGVVLHTEEGEDYALRHLENIWQKTNLAWSAGFVTTVHGNTLSSGHYESMMGKTITSLTYYTDQGVFEITLKDELYVPVKFAHDGFGVENAATSSNATEITGLNSIPNDYDAKYTVTGPDGKEAHDFTVNAEDKEIIWSGDASVGTYTLSVKDKEGKYADIIATFILYTEDIPVAAAADENGVWKLTPSNASKAAAASYLASVTSVEVDGKAYPASGRGSVKIIDPETGKIDMDAKSNGNPIFEQGNTYQIKVIAVGYINDLEFAMTVGDAPKQSDTGAEKEDAAVTDTSKTTEEDKTE